MHESLSLQFLSVPAQAPLIHLSFSVQALLSLQLVPSGCLESKIGHCELDPVQFSCISQSLAADLQTVVEVLNGFKGQAAMLPVQYAGESHIPVASLHLFEEELNKSLMSFFSELKKTGAEFGYRSASEILRFAAVVNKIETTWNMTDIIDAAIMQIKHLAIN